MRAEDVKKFWFAHSFIIIIIIFLTFRDVELSNENGKQTSGWDYDVLRSLYPLKMLRLGCHRNFFPFFNIFFAAERTLNDS